MPTQDFLDRSGITLVENERNTMSETKNSESQMIKMSLKSIADVCKIRREEVERIFI
jgi:hypothetical protein